MSSPVVLNRGNFLPPTKFSKAKCYNVASLLCIMVSKETSKVIFKCWITIITVTGHGKVGGVTPRPNDQQSKA